MTKKPETETFVPAEDFTGYPNGKRTEFKKGVRTEPLPAAFVELCRRKGHARKDSKMTVKLSSLAADLSAEAKGEWIDYPEWPGVAFNVRSLHYPPYATARDLLIQKMMRQNKGVMPPADKMAPEVGKLYCKHILHGWRGLDEEYTPEKALEVLCDPAYRRVVEAVEWCAGQVAQRDVDFVEDASKNSAAPSAKG